MDTSRLIINTIDKSSYNIENTTSVSGFTVVKAPKGPAYPIRIPAGGAAKIQDIFGVSSKDYPELFEVETFNKEFDVYVSAPYDEENTKVNVAFVTDEGIFQGSNPVTYDSEFESVVLGMDDDTTVDMDGKLGLDKATVEVLKDYRYSFSNDFLGAINYRGEKTGDELVAVTAADVQEGDAFLCTGDSSTEPVAFKEGVKYAAILSPNGDETFSLSWSVVGDLGESEYPGYEQDSTDTNNPKPVLLINTGIPFQFFKYRKFDFKIKGLIGSVNDTFTVTPSSESSVTPYRTSTITSKDNTSSQTARNVGKIIIPSYNESGMFIPKDPNTDAVNDNELVSFEIYGVNSSDIGVINNISGLYNDEANRASLRVFFEESISSSKVHGAICPKFASDRDLHISFAAFDDLTNYRSTNPVDRNILKMTIYEDGAFRDASHKLSVTGSLDVTDVDSNGASIGFSTENSSYSTQNLIYVYSKKKFTAEDDVNLNISKYPSITVYGGTRAFLEDDIKLHNIGWTKATDSDFSDVDVFFDSFDYSGKTIGELRSKSKFFSLVDGTSDGHNLAGYIFNYSVAPSVVDSFTKSANYLSFGRNYWNLCNMAVMATDDGSKFFSTMTGARALMQCRIIENRWGGAAPMWENEGVPGLGGQLDMINPLRLRYKYSKTQLDTLDKFNYNPVINDRQYGIMVVGHKTCKSGAITDWSYIGHACAFFNFLKEVRSNVMIPQIGKANNPYYRDLRNKQVSQYLRERLNGDNRIWAEASVDTSTADGVNDIYAIKALKFVINVSVKVDIFSEVVELNFTNEDQSTSISYEAD